MESRVLMKWRKNLGSATMVYIFLPILCIILLKTYDEQKNQLFLIVFALLTFFTTILITTSFNGWNKYVYLNEEKIWIRKKNQIIEWHLNDITDFRIVKHFCGIRLKWNSHFMIISKNNPKPLKLEYNKKVEKMLLEITKGKDVWKIFHKAFK